MGSIIKRSIFSAAVVKKSVSLLMVGVACAGCNLVKTKTLSKASSGAQSVSGAGTSQGVTVVTDPGVSNAPVGSGGLAGIAHGESAWAKADANLASVVSRRAFTGTIGGGTVSASSEAKTEMALALASNFFTKAQLGNYEAAIKTASLNMIQGETFYVPVGQGTCDAAVNCDPTKIPECQKFQECQKDIRAGDAGGQGCGKYTSPVCKKGEDGKTTGCCKLADCCGQEPPAHPGCYTGDQLIATIVDSGKPAGFKAIGFMNQDQATEVATLSADSVMGSFSFKTSAIKNFTADEAEGVQPYTEISTESGVELRVTPGHTFLRPDGTMTVANALQLGDILIRPDGSPDLITRLAQGSGKFIAHNLVVNSTSLTEQLLVAGSKGGVIVGSIFYQDHDLERFGRAIRRNQLDADLKAIAADNVE